MPNPEHLAKLKEGVGAWNAWREENPLLSPDLKEANLRGATLRNADLFEAIIFETNFAEANLTDVNLTRVACLATIFGAIDLTNAKGLESCKHVRSNCRGPCLLSFSEDVAFLKH